MLLRNIAEDKRFAGNKRSIFQQYGVESKVRVVASEIGSVFVRTESLVGVEDQLRQCCFDKCEL